MNLVKLLKENVVRVKFRHYKNEQTIEARGTLQGKNILDQHPNSDVVVFWDIDRKKWETVYKYSLVSYEIDNEENNKAMS